MLYNLNLLNRLHSIIQHMKVQRRSQTAYNYNSTSAGDDGRPSTHLRAGDDGRPSTPFRDVDDDL